MVNGLIYYQHSYHVSYAMSQSRSESLKIYLLTQLMALLHGNVLSAKQSMASQHRKHRGFRTERVVAEYLSTWWQGACVGRGSGKDIVNVPFDVEVKARAGFQPLAYLKQLKARTVISGELGFGVIRLNGQGEDAREYAAIIRLEDLLPLLILKYGHLDKEPTEADIDRCTACGSYMIRKCLTCQPTTIDVLNAISKMRYHTDGTIDH
jgi:hypothetical protein